MTTVEMRLISLALLFLFKPRRSRERGLEPSNIQTVLGGSWRIMITVTSGYMRTNETCRFRGFPKHARDFLRRRSRHCTPIPERPSYSK
jgi:hypothetical protein